MRRTWAIAVRFSVLLGVTGSLLPRFAVVANAADRLDLGDTLDLG